MSSFTLLFLCLLSALVLAPQEVNAWPYVDCSGVNPIFQLSSFSAHIDPASKSVILALEGNFTTSFLAQGYTAAATNSWRTSIITTNMGAKIHESQSTTCAAGGIIKGGCPTTPSAGSMTTNYTISQNTPFTELLVNLQIQSTLNNATVVCVAVLLEQTMPEVNTAVSYLPMALALYSGAISLTSIIMRATVGNGFLGALATYGLAATSEVINVHTPGIFDILFYTQFMLMTGQMSINYPSFYQTFTSLFHWSFLEFRNSFAGKGPENSTDVLMFGGAGSANQGKSSPAEMNDLSQWRRMVPALDGMVEGLDYPYSPSHPVYATMTTMPKAGPIQRKRQLSMTSNHQASVDPTPSPTTSTTSDSPSPSPTPDTTSSKTTKTTIARKTTTEAILITTTTTTAAPTPTSSTITPIITDPFNNINGSQQYNVSRFGIEAYAAAFGASPADLFLCTFVNIILAGGISLFLSAGFLIFAWLMATENHQKGKTLQHALNFVSGNLIRVWILFYTPLALSSMYQLTISGGTVMIVVAGASILFFSVGMTIFLTWRTLRAASNGLLFEDLGTLLRYGPLYNSLTEEGTLFFLVTLLVRFLWALSISMLSSYGVAQVAVTMAVELGYLVVIALKWPYSESGDNKFHLFLGTVRIVVSGCSIAYVSELDTDTEVRQLFGYIQMALHLTVFMVMFALVLWNTIQVIMFWRARHARAWKGPTKSYDFDEPTVIEPDWVVTGRPTSQRPAASSLGSLSPKTRHYTVQPYTSMSDLSQHPSLPMEGSQEDLFRHRSVYRMSHQPSAVASHRSRFLSGDGLGSRSEAVQPLSTSAGPMSHRSSSPPPVSPVSAGSLDGNAIPLQPAQSSFVRLNPPRESYAKVERMNHQQTPDPRTRRMSELFRDGRYLYEPSNTLGSSVHDLDEKEEKTSMWTSVKGSLGGLINLGKRSVKRNSGDGPKAKPKAFEVIRPPRQPIVMDSTDTRSQAGDDNLRELNSVGISRFFQESSGNYERNRSLFVANPEAMISQAGSLQSSVSGIPLAPALNRTASAATSVYTLNRQSRAKAAPNMSADLASILTGIETEQGSTESRRVSALSTAQPVYARNSVESNIAEAMMTETPLKLQGGGILKVSKGPEKAVQYWHKESGQYVESPADPSASAGHPLASPPLLLLPTTRSPFFESVQIDSLPPSTRSPFFESVQLDSVTPSTRSPFFESAKIDTNLKPTPSIKSRSGSRPDSPTESQSNNVAASAGRMQEILDRMFSDQDDDDDSDVISDDEESVSTFSGRVSAAILALQQRRQQEEQGDMHSLYRSDTLEPVIEHLDTDHSGDEGTKPRTIGGTGGGYQRKSEEETSPRRSVSGASGRPRDLNRSFSGQKSISSGSSSTLLLRPSKSGSLGRPLAQTPLHSPSIMPMNLSTSTLHPLSSLSRQSSQASLSRSFHTSKQDLSTEATSLSSSSSPVLFHGSVASSPILVSNPLTSVEPVPKARPAE
ncbi:hypothetical protein EMPS_09038 [Entomortierella parvispora]|uniref:TRP C-terminal domain-containing protein n=1 Tax=Entomortierella parvispora TaxID=205924 RepID=A0A9P3HH80_9FUNG|nr:hypothetical protein EMPS_09038 [Entomortierella parvispora]